MNKTRWKLLSLFGDSTTFVLRQVWSAVLHGISFLFYESRRFKKKWHFDEIPAVAEEIMSTEQFVACPYDITVCKAICVS